MNQWIKCNKSSQPIKCIYLHYTSLEPIRGTFVNLLNLSVAKKHAQNKTWSVHKPFYNSVCGDSNNAAYWLWRGCSDMWPVTWCAERIRGYLLARAHPPRDRCTRRRTPAMMRRPPDISQKDDPTENKKPDFYCGCTPDRLIDTKTNSIDQKNITEIPGGLHLMKHSERKHEFMVENWFRILSFIQFFHSIIELTDCSNTLTTMTPILNWWRY